MERGPAAPALLLVLAACHALPAATTDRPAAGASPEEDVAGWRGWKRPNAKRLLSRGHGYLWVDVYLEPAQADVYAATNVTVPAGFRVVKAGYEKQTGGEALGLTVMAKRPAGYDPPNGDWYYAVMEPGGARASTQGRLVPCIGCHRHAQPRDHLFGVATSN
jgi:hypothetical protein